MALKKPASVENDAFMSTKWDEVTATQEFQESDVSSLGLLCMWYKIAFQAQEELADFNNQTAYPSENGDLKPLPQIGTLRTASGEIRALNKQLGIVNKEDKQGGAVKKPDSVLEFVINDRRLKAQRGKETKEKKTTKKRVANA